MNSILDKSIASMLQYPSVMILSLTEEEVLVPQFMLKYLGTL